MRLMLTNLPGVHVHVTPLNNPMCSARPIVIVQFEQRYQIIVHLRTLACGAELLHFSVVIATVVDRNCAMSKLNKDTLATLAK